MPFATSYEKDGNIIRIKTDKSDLMLTIQDNETLIGEGFAKGIYKKLSSFKSKNKLAIGFYQTKSELNVRTGPGTNYAKIETLSKGTKVNVIEIIDNDWCEIEKDGYAGFVSKKYLIER